LIVLLSLIVLIALALFIVVRFYEDDVVAYAFEKSKSAFTTDVQIGNIELSFWETFPHAALHLQDVYIEETFEEKDTLVFAKSVFLEFSLMNLLRGNYQIHSIDVKSATCQLERNKKGMDNWHFWKTDDKDTSQFKLELEKIKISDTHFIYEDNKAQFFLDFTAKEGRGEGNFSSAQFEIETTLKGRLGELINGESDYTINRDLEIEASLNADTEKDLYTFNKCELNVEDIQLLVNGWVNASDDSSIDLAIGGDDVDLDELISILPESQKRAMKGYSPSGEVSIDISVKGKTSGKNAPLVDVHAVMHDGRFKHNESGTSLDNLSFDMRYERGKSGDQLKISTAQASLQGGQITVSGSLKNLSQPEFDLKVGATLDLSSLRSFFELDTLEIFQGNLALNAGINGKLDYIEADTTYNWRSLLTSGSAHLQNGVIRVKNSNRVFDAITADADFDRRNVLIRNLTGSVNGSDFTINGSLNNLIPFLSSDAEHLQLDAQLKSKLIDFTNLVETNTSNASAENYLFELPVRIDFDLKCQVDKFLFRKFEATQVRGVASLNQGVLTIDPVSFNTADGSFSAQIAMNRTSHDMYRLNCLATLNKINVSKLFTEFENFDQDFIQDKHLKGIANATVQFRTPMTTSLDVVVDKIESVIDISISNGELIGLESLQDIATYIKDNKWIAPFVNEQKFAESMKRITFSNLENVIEIRDRLINIPMMDIHSSALDIAAKGKHTFDNEIDYAIGFNLRDVLVRKEKEWQEADDGLGKRLYLSMKGTTDNPVFAMDRDMAKEVRKEDIEAEKANVKALLKEELGLFKKDKSVGNYKQETSPTGSTITLEWEDGNQPKPADPPTPKEEVKPKSDKPADSDKPKKKVPKWLEEKE
jgi:uncharacterized protein involved in outer membrane biogenesis